MKPNRFLLLLMMLVTTAVNANEGIGLLIPGEYHVLQWLPGSKSPGLLTGTVTSAKTAMQVQVSDEETEVNGSARLNASREGVTTLVMTLADGRESSCLITIDLDNYARLTCYTYQQDGSSKAPGVEAWFPKTPLDATR